MGSESMALVKHGILITVLPRQRKELWANLWVWPERQTNQKVAFDRVAILFILQPMYLVLGNDSRDSGQGMNGSKKMNKAGPHGDEASIIWQMNR